MTGSFREIINLWPKPAPDTLAVALGVKAETARKWRQRDNIPAEWWLAIVSAAEAIGQSITIDELATLAARKTAHNAAEPMQQGEAA